MRRHACIWFLVAVLLLPAFSCSRLPDKSAKEGPTVGSEQLPALDSIPAEWGRLVSVTTSPAFPNWFQLWFENETGTVRMAAFNFRTRQLDPDAMIFARK